MIVILATLARVGWMWWRRGLAVGPPRPPRAWAILLLCAAGVLVAAYLAYAETTHTAAICGPVRDCNTVQQSEYARLFGLLPVGVLGLVGYLVIAGLWAWGRYGRGPWQHRLRWGLPLVTLFGVAFSIYLTYG